MFVQTKPAQPTADELRDGLIEFPSSGARELKKYEDTAARETLMDEVGLALTGKPHPCGTDTQEYKDWYDQKLSIYRKDYKMPIRILSLRSRRDFYSSSEPTSSLSSGSGRRRP
jgi:hypothetical protein